MELDFGVLVVDDEPDMQWLYRQSFRKELRTGKVRLHFAGSGQEALDYLHRTDAAPIMFVLSDINMPGMSGLELVKRLKEEFSGLPVHLVTAYASEEYHRKALDSGADGFLTKPIDFDALKSRLGPYLNAS